MSQTELIDLPSRVQRIHHDSDRRRFVLEPEEAISGPEPTYQDAIAPPDEGSQAWIFLISCFAVEAIVWGFVFTYGVFQQVYESTDFKDQPNIPAIGTTASGIIYMASPLMMHAFITYPLVRKYGPLLGLLTMTAGIIGSSFATSVNQLIITQGLLYSIGGSLIYSPTIIYMDEWFIRRKGLAFGIMWAGTGLGGVIFPFILSASLQRYSFRGVLRIYAVVVFLLLAPAISYIRPRLPFSPPKRVDLSFLGLPSYILMLAGNIIESLGYFLPSIFLPSYASSIGASTTLATLSLVLFNIASVVGCILMGYLIDTLTVYTCILISTIGSVLSIFLVWGFSVSLPILYIFCILYGIFAGSFSSTWPGVMRTVAAKKPGVSPTMVFSFLAAGRGVGNVASGPISGGLVGGSGSAPGGGLGGGMFAYGGEYGWLIVFTGISALVSGVAVFARGVRR